MTSARHIFATRRIHGFCLYCGTNLNLKARSVACPRHNALLRVDPAYNAPDQWKAARGDS